MISSLHTIPAVQVRASRHVNPYQTVPGTNPVSRPKPSEPCVCSLPVSSGPAPVSRRAVSHPSRESSRDRCNPSGGCILQHPPMRCTSHLHPKCRPELQELDLAQGLREDVRGVFVRRDRDNFDVVRLRPLRVVATSTVQLARARQVVLPILPQAVPHTVDQHPSPT